MSANDDRFDAWADQAHQLAGLNPRGYGRRIVGLALIGALILHSVWLLSMLAASVLVALAAWQSGWSLLIPAAGFVWLGSDWLGALLHVDKEPLGVGLDAQNAPALIKLISKVASDLGAPNPTRVELVPEFNAWVQVHRRPLGQWHLSLGLPLMLASEVHQFTAVVGHELGHFVAGTAGARLVWSQQAGWHDTLRRLGSSRLGVLARGAFRSWGLRFQAEAVAMARQHERSADAAGAKVAGARASAQALIILELAERALSERFWPEVWKRVGAGPPPEAVFVELRHFVGALGREDIDRYYRSALLEPTLTFDVHPSLSDRVAALGEKPALPAPVTVSAAAELLGDQLERLSLLLGKRWAQRVGSEWAEARDEAKRLDQVLAANQTRTPTDLHPADALELARAFRRAGRLTQALPCYRRAAELNPDDAATRLGMGLALLETGDARGLVDLRLGVSLSQGHASAVFEAFWGARRFLEARAEPQKNPFTSGYHRLRLNWGREEALLEWGRRSVW